MSISLKAIFQHLAVHFGSSRATAHLWRERLLSGVAILGSRLLVRCGDNGADSVVTHARRHALPALHGPASLLKGNPRMDGLAGTQARSHFSLKKQNRCNRETGRLQSPGQQISVRTGIFFHSEWISFGSGAAPRIQTRNFPSVFRVSATHRNPCPSACSSLSRAGHKKGIPREMPELEQTCGKAFRLSVFHSTRGMLSHDVIEMISG